MLETGEECMVKGGPELIPFAFSLLSRSSVSNVFRRNLDRQFGVLSMILYGRTITDLVVMTCPHCGGTLRRQVGSWLIDGGRVLYVMFRIYVPSRLFSIYASIPRSARALRRQMILSDYPGYAAEVTSSYFTSGLIELGADNGARKLKTKTARGRRANMWFRVVCRRRE